jgi:hypothetical protein
MKEDKNMIDDIIRGLHAQKGRGTRTHSKRRASLLLFGAVVKTNKGPHTFTVQKYTYACRKTKS